MPETAVAEVIDTSNSIFQKAVSFVKDTHENLFLTGRAGTGKTTFLKYIREHSGKQCAVIAPTGVAAINAGGETIHSFLQLPFSPFVPGSAGFGRATGAEDKHSLLANLRLRDTKLKLLRKLELLIIDEVSMVRCDLLDAMDLVLRHVRKNWLQPFGGVQMLFIGDLFQLPPVAPEEDWYILRQFYQSPYFFESKVLRETPPVYIELKKIYRQKEQTFIDILNRVRNGLVQPEDVETLNKQYDPLPQKEKGFIILSTHNHIADKINLQSLEELPGKLHSFTGTIKNEFNPKNLPTEEVLQIKEGAQVMFVKNDLQSPRRYYNGKIALVSKIDADGIHISFPEEGGSLLLELETWRNMRYTLNTQKGEIEEEESGSFTQYPIRLAWAITVHKSQGLTLQKAVVDLNQSFAPGQVYVALSRCTTMEGLVLRSKLNPDNIITDSRVLDFAANECDEHELDAVLMTGKRKAYEAQLCRIFAFTQLIESVEKALQDLMKRKTGPKEKNLQLAEEMLSKLTKAQQHAAGFHKEIRKLVAEGEYSILSARKRAGVTYFTEQVLNPLTEQADAHITSLGTLTKVAKQVITWKVLSNELKDKVKEIKGVLEL